jgi:DNA-binding response OmpR family regulator
LRVLVIEDVGTIAAIFESALRRAGMEVACVPSGQFALAARTLFRPEIVVLDLSLPDMDGLDLILPFTEDGAGVIVVTATGEEEARVRALDIGADDYMVKPVLVHELAARVRAVHRRLQGRSVAGGRFARIIVNAARRALVAQSGTEVALTEAEMLALEALLEANGTPVSREWVGRVALKRVLLAEDRSVDQLILKLRRKLSSIGCPERTIMSVRRQGYVMADPGLFEKRDDMAAL